jgi:hypothetical protein
MGQLPFWYDLRLSPATVLYACALTLLGAAIAGGLPGSRSRAASGRACGPARPAAAACGSAACGRR